jgi:L-ascorbate metabolism protein UlaG (beta-lactamase superfamily)
MMAGDADYWDLTRKFFSKKKDARPSVKLPSVKTNLHDLNDHQAVIVWFGHSSYFIRINGKNILVDPVFSGYASPLKFMVTAFAGSDIYTTEEMPEIDYLLITHDHYDHMDYHTLKKLKAKVGKVYCSLGVGSHLRHWGYAAGIIHEMDWWQEENLPGGIQLVAAPARHFSGRGMQRYKTLWSSFILITKEHNVYLGGDSGYDTHFRIIGDKFGPFDIAILEAGQYNTAWPLIHMMPEETVLAAKDLGAKVLMPVHWGKFTLALHAWNEPPQRVVTEATKHGLTVTTPMIGEAIIIGRSVPVIRWWEGIK